ncbi:MAG: hypothetical protein N3I35_10765 [Clostridia bacterium]|nr:hypothetical protein [Clostridia bacterium]
MLRYYAAFYTLLAVMYIAIFIKPQRIKQLLPVGLLSALVIFCQTLFFKLIGAYGFNNPILPIFGVPIFAIALGFCYGIIVMHHMPRQFHKKLLTITVFIIFTRLADMFATYTGYHVHYNFHWYNVIVQDFAATSLIVFLSEGIFGKRIQFQ